MCPTSPTTNLYFIFPTQSVELDWISRTQWLVREIKKDEILNEYSTFWGISLSPTAELNHNIAYFGSTFSAFSTHELTVGWMMMSFWEIPLVGVGGVMGNVCGDSVQ